jgi:uncharacterized protein YjeT (DUF2065 family)
MDSSTLIGRLFAVVYIAVGLGMLLRPSHYGKMLTSFTENPAVLYLGGAMALTAGMLIVMFHNVWSGGWVVLLTIIGWLALVKGCLILILPDIFGVKVGALMGDGKRLRPWGGFALVLGLVIGYFSFFA